MGAGEERAVAPRQGRVGGRWINQEPEAGEFAEWFATNVRLHEGLEHSDYVAGITLIQQTATNKHAIVGYSAQGAPLIAERSETIFTPYPRVDARVHYFWNLMALHDGWEGEILPVSIGGEGSEGLPDGYFKLKLPAKNGDVPFIGRAMVVVVTNRHDEHPLGIFPSESKVVPLLNRYGDLDEHALAKASTGAIGRALGVAGMLILPGSGVATAEDIFEVLSGGGSAAAAEVAAALPRQPSTDEQRAELTRLLVVLDGSDQREAIREWWGQRRFPGAERLGDQEVSIALQKAQQLAVNAVPVEHVADEP